MSSLLTELFGEPISIYTRAQGFEDGALIDVSATAQEAGFRVPVAITAALYADIATIPADVSWQSLSGRLWDVLVMARTAALYYAKSPNGFLGLVRPIDECSCRYCLILYTEVGQFEDGACESRLPKYWIKMVSGPGDAGEHVITLMKPDED